MKLNIICYGNTHLISATSKEALDVVIDRAWKKAGIALKYQTMMRWELRTWDGALLETHRSVASYQLGDGAKLSLSPTPGHGG